jgi:hypothetical protein
MLLSMCTDLASTLGVLQWGMVEDWRIVWCHENRVRDYQELHLREDGRSDHGVLGNYCETRFDTRSMERSLDQVVQYDMEVSHMSLHSQVHGTSMIVKQRTARVEATMWKPKSWESLRRS